MMPGGYLEEALYGAYVGTVTVDGPPLSDRDRQRFFSDRILKMTSVRCLA
jgi:hypothetical protein